MSYANFRGKVVYSLVSSAYFVDKSWGYGVPHQGMKLMFDIGRRHHIPVTYIITSQVAREHHRMLTQFHKEGNACIALMLEFPDQLNVKGVRVKGSDDIIAEMSVDEIREYIRKETVEIKRFLPWAEIKVLGAGYRTEKVVAAAEAEGLIGLWGYCIFQIGTDNITDYGCPWGQFFIDHNNYKAPSPASTPGKVVGLEWTCRDISKAFHMAKSESYSTDPNDAESNSKCTESDIAYWVDLLREYQENLRCNDMVFFLQHQESHEMEVSEVCVGYDHWRVQVTTDMLDKFCAHVVAQPNVACVTLNQACEIYHDAYHGKTPPTYFYQRDISIHTPGWQDLVARNKADGSKHLWLGFHEKMYNYVDKFTKQPAFHFREPPWHDALFYFDTDAMFVFDQGVREPVWITDYRCPSGSRDEQFMWVPSVPLVEISEKNQGFTRTIEYVIESDKVRPYALFEWQNLGYGNFQITECTARQCKVFEYAGVFMRFELHQGTNRIKLELKGEELDSE